MIKVCITAYIKFITGGGIHWDGWHVQNDGFFAVAIILTSFLILSKIPILNKILGEMGKYSTQIFMFHSFFTSYLKDFIYWFKYPIVIFTVLSVICYVVARLFEGLKHIVRYDRLLNKLLSK